PGIRSPTPIRGGRRTARRGLGVFSSSDWSVPPPLPLWYDPSLRPCLFTFPSLPCYLLLQFLALFDLVHVANSILIFVVTWQAGQLRRTADWVYTQV
ncbi:hypothetical protein BHM03_00002163, partial [Ensete ventricosum]